MGSDVDVMPATVNLTAMRKFLHTPKDGIQLPQDTKYYTECIKQNEFLKEFINNYDAGL